MLFTPYSAFFTSSTRRKFCPPDHWITQVDLSLSNVSVQFLDLFETRDPIDEDDLQNRYRAMQEEEDDLIDYLTAPRPPSIVMNTVTYRQAENAITLLKNVPFMVPFEDRVNVFHALIHRDRQVSMARSTPVTVRRNHVFEDGFKTLAQTSTFPSFPFFHSPTCDI